MERSINELPSASEQKNEIILYQPDDLVRLEVRMEGETVWLNRQQMSLLFGRDVKTIGKHISNALKEELSTFPVVANFATTAIDGKTYQVRYYNLDMILSVGYRVKSSRGIEFRRWANHILKDYLLKGYSINQRLSDIETRIDNKLMRHEQRLDQIDQKIDFFVRTSLPPVEGIFFDGQIFDAYAFVSDLIRSAHKDIILIDNYVDESVLILLDKRQQSINAAIYSGHISKQLQLDIQRHNAQYPPIEVHTCNNVHDRFLIIDNVVYHIGASLKDLGKKLFAFSKMAIPSETLLQRILSAI